MISPQCALHQCASKRFYEKDFSQTVIPTLFSSLRFLFLECRTLIFFPLPWILQLPAMFVRYMPKEHLSNNSMAIILGAFGKVWLIQLEINLSDVFSIGCWAQFLAFNGITEANSLLLRYEGNMTFKIKVFEPDGCQREFKHQGEQQIIEFIFVELINNGLL